MAQNQSLPCKTKVTYLGKRMIGFINSRLKIKKIKHELRELKWPNK